MLPQLAEWQAAGKVNGILVIDGEKSEPVSLGGYKITLSAGMGFGTPAPKPDSDDGARRGRYFSIPCDAE